MEDLSIRKLVLDHVGVFEHLELEFPRKPAGAQDKAEIHIFTGENGTGKTTLLESMTSIDYGFNLLIDESGVKSRRKTRIVDKTNISTSKSRIEFAAGEIHFETYKLRSEAARKMNFGPLEKHFQNYFRTYPEEDSKFHSYCFFAYNGFRRLNEETANSSESAEFDPIEEALNFEKGDSQSDLFEWIKDNKTRAALAFQAGNLKGSEKYLEQIRKIEEAIGQIIGRNLRFIIHEKTLKVRVLLDDVPIALNSLPDGYQSVISWLTDLLFRLDYLPDLGKENFTLFLDEIDIHLHPAAQRRILPVIQKLFPKAQIFLTTHSPFVIGSVDDAWVYKFKLDEKGNSVLDKPPFLSEDAQSYSYILENVFGIQSEFGIGAEQQLVAFSALRNQVLSKPDDASWAKLNRMGSDLAAQSHEMASIIGFELRQAARILQKDVTI